MTPSLKEFKGDRLYIDTMVLYAFSRGIELSARYLFAQIEAGQIQGTTSVLAFDELAYRLLLALIRDHFPGSPLDHLRREEQDMMTKFSAKVSAYLNKLRDFQNLSIVEVIPADLSVMTDAMVAYSLRPRDGLHLAAMKRIGCQDIVSNDAHFDRVPDLRRYELRE